MDIVQIAIWLALGMTALGLGAILLFAVLSVANGKFRPNSLIALVVPAVVFGISYVISSGGPDPVVQAVILTSLILIVLGFVAILLSGLKGVIGL
jgi:hypothetical protein